MQLKKLILRNRYTLLLTTLMAYMGVLVAEGAITGREVREIEFENPFFDLNINDLEYFMENDRDRESVSPDAIERDSIDAGDV